MKQKTKFAATTLLAGLVVFVLGVDFSLAQVAALPRVQSGNFEYLGAFALPQGEYGDSRFGYSGRAVTPYNDPATGKKTLFMEGHDWDSGTVGQVEIPESFSKSGNYNDLPEAVALQNFRDIADGKWASTGQTSYLSVFGMLPYNGRLIVAATSWYDASCSQCATHGVSNFNLGAHE